MRQRSEHGGLKVGAAFFGWLTALGTGVLAVALLAAAGAAVDISSPTELANQTDAISAIGGVLVGVVLFRGLYFAGGYVAGRMSRFDGVRQGVLVWVVALVVAAVLALIAAVAGDQYNVLSSLNGFPRLPAGTEYDEDGRDRRGRGGRGVAARFRARWGGGHALPPPGRPHPAGGRPNH